jgi:hypothetical protein
MVPRKESSLSIEFDPASFGAKTATLRVRRSLHDVDFDGADAGEFCDLLQALIHRTDLDDYFAARPQAEAALREAGATLAEQAYGDRNADSLLAVHRALYMLYEDNLRPAGRSVAFNQFNPQLIALRNTLERRWEAFERRRAAVDLDTVPVDPSEFGAYFRGLCRSHPMVGHPLFDFLQGDAKRDDLIAFFLSDAAVIVRFCDLVVLSMVGIDDEIRPELAENFWDEMGRGAFQERHVALYRDLLEYAGVNLPGESLMSDQFADHLRWQGYAGYNLYLFLSLHRKNQFRSLGALGAAEMMDPDQYAKVLAGCRRVGLEDADRLAYYAGHAEMDIAHGDGWCDNVLLPLVAKYPDRRGEIVEGALIRMNVTLDYYDDLLRRMNRR